MTCEYITCTTGSVSISYNIYGSFFHAIRKQEGETEEEPVRLIMKIALHIPVFNPIMIYVCLWTNEETSIFNKK